MNRKTRENLLYVGEELGARFGKPLLMVFVLLALGVGMAWGFQRVDAYLTPSASPPAPLLQTEVFSLAIPKIGIEAPIHIVESKNPDEFLGPLQKGVALYPSALPGEKGASIVLGHSAPFGWLGNPYKDIFSDLQDLEQGDGVLVKRDRKSHAYKVVGKRLLARGQDIPQELLESNQPRLLLISCWPPGIDNKRIIIQADSI